MYDDYLSRTHVIDYVVSLLEHNILKSRSLIATHFNLMLARLLLLLTALGHVWLRNIDYALRSVWNNIERNERDKFPWVHQ